MAENDHEGRNLYGVAQGSVGEPAGNKTCEAAGPPHGCTQAKADGKCMKIHQEEERNGMFYPADIPEQ